MSLTKKSLIFRMEQYLDEGAGRLVSLSNKPRRIKRAVPDTEKDEQYWKRRCMNNIAAKRSRENKRQHEIRLQNKVLQLEEENVLLKKELETIKLRFNIPQDENILNSKVHEDCLKGLWLNPDLYVPISTKRSQNNVHVRVKQERPVSPCEENSKTLTDMMEHIPHLKLIPAHIHSGNIFQENRLDVTPGNNLQTYCDPKTDLENIRDSSCTKDLSAMPTDLSTKKKVDRDTLSGTAGDHSTKETNDLSSKQGEANEDDDVATFNAEIKTKLQILSDQVEKMQRLVCDKDTVSR